MAWERPDNSGGSAGGRSSNKAFNLIDKYYRCFVPAKFRRRAYRIFYHTGKKALKVAAGLWEAFRSIWETVFDEGFSKAAGWLRRLSEFKSSSVGRGEASLAKLLIRICKGIFKVASMVFRAIAERGFSDGLRLLVSASIRLQKRFRQKYGSVLSFAAPVAGAAVLLVTVAYWSHICFALSLTYNGKQVGLVASESEFRAAVNEIETKVADASSGRFTMDKNVSYRLVVTQASQLTSKDALYDNVLMASGSTVSEGYGLYVDGRLIGSNKDGTAVRNMLEQILDPYRNKPGYSRIGFVQKVEIKRGIYPAGVEKEVGEMSRILCRNVKDQKNYTAQKGDSPIKVATMFHLTLDKLYVMNPSIASGSLFQGQTIVVETARPYLTVKLIKNIVYRQDIAFDVKQIPSDSLYKGDTKIIRQGIRGTSQIVAAATYVGQTEVSQKVLSRNVLTQPEAQQVLVGTKPKPATEASGSFIWPVYSGSGYISCPFGGYSGHTGADYACAEGTPVKAADAGTVVSAGWDGGYGNCVKISHGNGIMTIYAHCSALLVSTGEKVYKGQLISRVGHTGHVIGNPGDHLHFEIRVNSVAVNPFRFVTP